MGVVKAGIAVAAGLLLAVVAFRRARGVLTLEERRAARPTSGLVLAGAGLAALAAIVWLTRQLFG